MTFDTNADIKRSAWLQAIRKERERQLILKAQGRFKYTPDEVPLSDAYTMLSEEVGEVARAILALKEMVQEEPSLPEYRKELVQVAAIALAMLEGTENLPAGAR